jgi:hypothetical protein
VLWGEILVAGSITADAAHLVGSSAAVFTAMELVSAFGTMAVASEIGGAAFASTSAFGSSAVA